MQRAAALLAALALAATVPAQAAGQLAVRDPHVPTPAAALPRDEFIVVDDMWFLPGQLEEDTRQRTHGLAIDFRLRLGTWDAGVIPYVISEEFTPAERQRIFNSFQIWSSVAPVVFVARTTQSGYLTITRDAEPGSVSPCFSSVGQARRGSVVRTNLGGTCASSSRTVSHELGHALGLYHEQSRGDRDDYLTVDTDNIIPDALSNFRKLTALPLLGSYDFGSIMHYRQNAFAVDTTRPTLIPHAPHASWAARMGTLTEPSESDHAVVAFLYNQQHRESTIRTPTEPMRTRFDRADFLLAMERLHAYYMSRWGLQREGGLSIGGRPDFLGIAQWIFDVYLPARSAGFSAEGAFDIVIAAITRTDEWRQKNPQRTPLTPASFRGVVSLDRNEFLDVLTRLDRFYAAPEGLQRPGGLSINGGPDFLGIATWIFDVYLNQRLLGAGANAAWVATESAIRATDEWRRKHP